MKKHLLCLFLAVSVVFALILSGCDAKPETSVVSSIKPSVTDTSNPSSITPSSTLVAIQSASLELENYDGGYFSIKKPVGWDVVTAGGCSTFSFYIADKNHPANRIFYIGEVGPVYLAEEQKTIDQNYVSLGGSLPTWFEMPVINPLTPENLLAGFHLVAQTTIAQKFMPGLPELGDIEIISAVEETTFITGGQTKTIRALFRQGGELGEGLFYITVAPVIPLTGYAWGGIGYGFCMTGITALQSDFKFYEKSLYQSISSLNLSQSYIDNCLQQQQQQGVAARNLSETLSETSDILMDSWESRNRSDDILSEKRSDVILGSDRVYNPDTGEVYEVPLDFYDNYNIHRDNYDMDNLQKLPDQDWNLWTAPTNPDTEIR